MSEILLSLICMLHSFKWCYIFSNENEVNYERPTLLQSWWVETFV